MILFWLSAAFTVLFQILGTIWGELIRETIGALPNFSLILLFVYAIRRGADHSIWLGLIGGLSADFLSAIPLGYTVFPRVLLGYLAGVGKGKIYLDPFLMPLGLGFIITLANGFIESLLGSIFGISPGFLMFTRSVFWFEALYNALLTPLFLLLMDNAVKVWIKPYEQRERI
jgi:rod shape-determining protein MreD